jgi:hypothetical protein
MRDTPCASTRMTLHSAKRTTAKSTYRRRGIEAAAGCLEGFAVHTQEGKSANPQIRALLFGFGQRGNIEKTKKTKIQPRHFMGKATLCGARLRGSLALLLSCLLQCTSEEDGLRPASVPGEWLRADTHVGMSTAQRLQAAARRAARQGAEEGEDTLFCKWR